MRGIIFVSSENGVTINLMVAISFLPGGYRNNNNGSYNNMNNNGYFWSATESGDNAWKRNLNYNNTDVNRNNNNKRYGFSVRCVRDLEFNIISLLRFFGKTTSECIPSLFGILPNVVLSKNTIRNVFYQELNDAAAFFPRVF